MTKDEKIEYVAGNAGILSALQNDLWLVVESGCPEHGCGTGPNFTLALLCMVACETAGALSAPKGLQNFAATRNFISRLGHGSSRERYEAYAGLLFHFFRNGIGHSFRPKQGKRLSGWTWWMAPCIDRLRNTQAGRLHVDNVRLAQHLVVEEHPAGRRFNVVTKILYLDVDRAISEFRAALNERQPYALGSFEWAFDRWERLNEQIPGKRDLSDMELALIAGDGASDVLSSDGPVM